MTCCLTMIFTMELAQKKWVLVVAAVLFITVAMASPQPQARVGEFCAPGAVACETGLICSYCIPEDYHCIQPNLTNPFNLTESRPLNHYAFLTTYKSFAIDLYRPFSAYQEDNITEQLNNGVRGLMLSVYTYKQTAWLCDTIGEECNEYTAYGSLLDTLSEVENFLATNRREIVILILEDHVKTKNALSRIINRSGLKNYRLPLAKMPRGGGEWPLVKTMLNNNERLIILNSNASKEKSEGIAYKGNYMVESQNVDDLPSCDARNRTPNLKDMRKSLVLINHVSDICKSSPDFLQKLKTCYTAANGRWANFVSVSYYKRSNGIGAFGAIDFLNGKLQCGADNIKQCRKH